MSGPAPVRPPRGAHRLDTTRLARGRTPAGDGLADLDDWTAANSVTYAIPEDSPLWIDDETSTLYVVTFLIRRGRLNGVPFPRYADTPGRTDMRRRIIGRPITTPMPRALAAALGYHQKETSPHG